MSRDHSQHDAEPQSFWSTRYAIGLIVLGAIAAYVLLTEHRAHFFGALPWLLLLACPLMHLFMHGGHGRHGGHGGQDGGEGHHHGGQQRVDASAALQPPKTGDQP